MRLEMILLLDGVLVLAYNSLLGRSPITLTVIVGMTNRTARIWVGEMIREY